jgi:hypothetical protein
MAPLPQREAKKGSPVVMVRDGLPVSWEDRPETRTRLVNWSASERFLSFRVAKNAEKLACVNVGPERVIE